MLLEREHELGLIGEWLSDAREGRGRIAVIRGGAGLGKTALLERAVRLASSSRIRVLSARGSELEREMPFGMARQLFEAPVRSLEPDDRQALLRGPAAHTQALLGLTADPAGSGDPLGVIHGMYWLTANFCDIAPPLLLALDDVHWADPQTVRWITYLSARVADLPVLMLATARFEENGPGSIAAAIEGNPHASAVALEPLGIEAVGQLVYDQFARSGDPDFIEACHRASGGNPFFAIELLRAAAVDGIEPTRQHASAVQRLGPTEVARSILIRLAGLGDEARRLANAAAVLGPDAALRHCAQLSGLRIEQALAAWDALTRAEILEPSQPLRFIHPIARTAVYRELPPGERTRLHRSAAAILAGDGAERERIAVHAAECEPAGDLTVVRWLREAARYALGSGAPDAAERYLRRALAESPPRAERAELQFDLGMALAAVDMPAAAASFQQAAAATGNDSVGMLAHRWAGYTLALGGSIAQALSSFDHAVELAGDPDLALLIASTRDGFAGFWAGDPDRSARLGRLREWGSTLGGVTTGEQRALAIAAMSICITGNNSAARALKLSEKAACGELSFTNQAHGDETTSAVATTRLFCDDPRPPLYETLRDEVINDGLVLKGAFMHAAAAQFHFRRGALLEAEIDARTGWEVFAPLSESPTTMYWWTLLPLVQALIARGLLSEAEALIVSTGLMDADLEVVTFPWPPVLGAELALAQGRIGEAAGALLEAGGWLEERGFANPAFIPWRALAGPALATLGRNDEAREVIEPAVRRARHFGAPWGLGMTLRAAGTIEQGERGIELLREAVAVLEPSPCRLERAHALLELGAALRRANQRVNAREPLRSALELANRCGAEPLAARAEQELAATGARPRRVMLTGLESLTASERRVAELAASGLSNPEIAQRLFVTRKTVETHLGHAYTKLNIQSRHELTQAITGTE